MAPHPVLRFSSGMITIELAERGTILAGFLTLCPLTRFSTPRRPLSHRGWPSAPAVIAVTVSVGLFPMCAQRPRSSRSAVQAAKKKRAPLIKTRLRRIVLAPVSALVVLWLIGSVYLAYGTVVQYAYVQANDRLLLPSALALTAVMDERSVTMAYLDRPRETRETLLDVRADVDQRMGNILDEFRGLLSLSPEKVQKRITYLDEKFKEIGELRARVDQGNIDREEVEEYYNDLVMAGADLFDEQARSVPSPEVVGPSVSAVSMFRVVDALARADAKLSRGFATGEFSMDDQHEFVAQVGAYESMLEAVDDYLG